MTIAHQHRTPPELFDRDLAGDYDSVFALGLFDLAQALHDYGTRRRGRACRLG